MLSYLEKFVREGWGEQCHCFLGACVPLEVHCCKMAAARLRCVFQLELLISFETSVFVIIHGQKTSFFPYELLACWAPKWAK